MTELVARAALHRTALGQPGAAEHAAALVAGVANPWLARTAAGVVARAAARG
jgi:hypothetical protein